jgi:hypothetical protein
MSLFTPKGLNNKAGGRASRTPGTRQLILPRRGYISLEEASYATPPG